MYITHIYYTIGYGFGYGGYGYGLGFGFPAAYPVAIPTPVAVPMAMPVMPAVTPVVPMSKSATVALPTPAPVIATPTPVVAVQQPVVVQQAPAVSVSLPAPIPTSTTIAPAIQAQSTSLTTSRIDTQLPDIMSPPHITQQLSTALSTTPSLSKQHTIQPVNIPQPSILQHVYHQRVIQPEITYVVY